MQETNFLSFMIATTLVLSACQSISASGVGEEVSIEGGSYRVVSVQELQGMLENKDFTMINVHTPVGRYSTNGFPPGV